MLVVEFTVQRGGVYYEAGLADGLDIPVGFAYRERDVKDLHFDTQQYNHIVWKRRKNSEPSSAIVCWGVGRRIGDSGGWAPASTARCAN
jgi:hypothetical protein